MHPRKIVSAYKRGENITSLLREHARTEANSEEIIETAYDLQSGSYIRAVETPEMRAHKVAYGKAIADDVLSRTSPSSIIETGVGEGTTLSFVLDAMGKTPDHVHGFDISWSRTACCRDWLKQRGYPDAFLSVASLFHLPYSDSCFDVVYTSHTIEPNGGMEAQILKELFRVTSRFLILLEPAYELAPEEARQRMEQHGYCKGLASHAESLGMHVVKHELFPHAANPLNPTAITVIEKAVDGPPAVPQLACPRFGDVLQDHGDSLYSPDTIRAYPKILGIPCLRPEDGIIASGYENHVSG